MLNRRQLIGGAAGGAAIATLPGMAVAQAGGDKRFVFIIQRGAADWLNIVVPVGDPDYKQQRGALAVTDGLPLTSMFALHPALPEVAKLYAAQEALFVHAVASPYRDRSHFDGQNVLESGGQGAYQLKDGWMNRLLPLLPKADSAALALASAIPMALRGPAPVGTYAPTTLPTPSDDLLDRVGALYNGDAQLHALWAQAQATRMATADLTQLTVQNGATTGALAARLLTGPGSARILMVETGGWDTHAAQNGRLAGQLKGLDSMIAALKTGLGNDWRNTVVLVATEFGRTVAANGTGGTDHGTASGVMIAGGAVNGGTVIADWPGLATANLYEGRDLRPTIALDALVAAVLAQHYRLSPAQAMTALFPGSGGQAFTRPLVSA